MLLSTAVPGCGGGGGGGTQGGTPDPAPPPPGVVGPAWWGFGRDAQHSGLGAIAPQDLNRIAWSMPIDLAPQYQSGGELLIHYGSPVVTSNNTVIVPVKTGATGGFRVEARSGTDGTPLWRADSDYVLPASRWTPSFNVALTRASRLYVPAAGGKLLVRDAADSPGVAFETAVFYGSATYAADPTAFDAAIMINTPLTIDASGTVYFGFVAAALNPAGLASGIARVAADASGRWGQRRGDRWRRDARQGRGEQCTGAVAGPDDAVRRAQRRRGQSGGSTGYLLALDAPTLALKGKAAFARSRHRHARADQRQGHRVAHGRTRRRGLFRRPREHLRQPQRARLAAAFRCHAGADAPAGRIRLGRHGVDRAALDAAGICRSVGLTC